MKERIKELAIEALMNPIMDATGGTQPFQAAIERALTTLYNEAMEKAASECCCKVPNCTAEYDIRKLKI